MEISVLLSSHNKAATIERAIRSVAQQSHPPCEIIVCEDCSTDDTQAILRRLFGELSVPLHLIEYEQKAPDWIAAYLDCAKQCRGDYIHLLAADDYILPGFYTECAKAWPMGILLADTRTVNAAGQQQRDSHYHLKSGPHFQDLDLHRWLLNPAMPGGVPTLLSKPVVEWLRTTHVERCVTWMDSVGYAAAMWPFGVYYIPEVYGIYLDAPGNFGGPDCPPARLAAGRAGTKAWLDDPMVIEAVPPDIRLALALAVG